MLLMIPARPIWAFATAVAATVVAAAVVRVVSRAPSVLYVVVPARNPVEGGVV